MAEKRFSKSTSIFKKRQAYWSNIVAAVRITGWTLFIFFAHTLVVQEVIEIDSALLSIKKKCKDIITFFHHSVNGAQKLREIQRQIGL